MKLLTKLEHKFTLKEAQQYVQYRVRIPVFRQAMCCHFFITFT